MVEAVLGELELGPALQRAVELVAQHEQPSPDPELQVLNDADGLSFFSLNSPGFLAYFGAEHTLMKVRYTLQRMRPGAKRHVRTLRLPPFVSASAEACLAS